MLDEIGYDSSAYEIIDNIGRQSSDIALGVDIGGAGDQGMMFGYACDDTEELLPLAQVILQKLSKEYFKLMFTGKANLSKIKEKKNTEDKTIGYLKIFIAVTFVIFIIGMVIRIISKIN